MIIPGVSFTWVLAWLSVSPVSRLALPLVSSVMLVWEVQLNNRVSSSVWSWFSFSPRYWVSTALSSPSTSTLSKRPLRHQYWQENKNAPTTRRLPCKQKKNNKIRKKNSSCSPKKKIINITKHTYPHHSHLCIPLYNLVEKRKDDEKKTKKNKAWCIRDDDY